MFSVVKHAVAVAATGLVLCFGSAEAGTVVVNADEWALSNSGFASAGSANVTRFVSNIVDEFGPVLHAFSTNFGFTQGDLATAMSAAGATYTTGTGFAFTAANISMFDGLLLGGTYLSLPEQGVLADYVAAGGSVYIAAGTGVNGAAGEAAAWNGFLVPFGITLSAPYTGFDAVVTTGVSTDPLLDGVAQVLIRNPNGLSGNVICCDAAPVIAIARTGGLTTPIPLPASGLMLGAAVIAGGLVRLRGARDRDAV